MKNPNPPYSEPAFPRPASVHEESQMVQWAQEGMGLRDWFAGQALLIAEMSGYTPEWAARRAYEYADAMLKEREK